MEASRFPLTYDVAYPQQLSRGLIFVKWWLLAIPHYLFISALNGVHNVVTLIAFFAILFTAKFPRGLFDFMVGVNRWNANVAAYALFMRDEYPPFDLAAGKYPVTYEVAYPEAERLWATALSLPCYPSLADAEVDAVAAALVEALTR